MNESIEIACKDLVFHFNTGHLADPTIPMWVVKTKGKTYYVEHVNATIPWSTKETPDNDKTKGSLKFKNCLCTIDDDNIAALTVLTEKDKKRLSFVEEKPVRLILIGGPFSLDTALKDAGVNDFAILEMGGGCSEVKRIVELDKSHATFLILKHPELRILTENEVYYKSYSKWKGGDKSIEDDDSDYDEDDNWGDDDDDDEELLTHDEIFGINDPSSLRWTNPQEWKKLFNGLKR